MIRYRKLTLHSGRLQEPRPLQGWCFTVLLTAIWFAAEPACAQVTWSSLGDNMRRTVDFSSRTLHTEAHTWHVLAAGLDVHTVIAGKRGDIGTLTFQPYLLRIDDAPAAGGLFEDEHDWALQWRIANFNYTGLGHGRFNVRVGHFEIPFGLEQVEQTNGTLYQMNSPAALGLKADWGASVNGVMPRFDYEFSYTLGTGNEISDSDGGLVAGRIGTRLARIFRVGASFLDGEQREPTITKKERYGIDLSAAIAPGLDVAVDASRGFDEQTRVSHWLWQVSWTSSMQDWLLYLQLRDSRHQSSHALEEHSNVSLGVRFEPNIHWSVSAQWDRDTAPSGMDSDRLIAQFRYRL